MCYYSSVMLTFDSNTLLQCGECTDAPQCKKKMIFLPGWSNFAAVVRHCQIAYMDDDGGLSMRHWPYYDQSLRGNLSLQLMSSTIDRHPKPLHSNGPLLSRDGRVPEPSFPMNFVRDGWIHQNSVSSKMIHMLSVSHKQHQQQQQQHQQQQQQQQDQQQQQQHHHQMSYSVIPDLPAAHTIQMLQHQEQPKNDKSLDPEKPNGGNEASIKKRSQGRRMNPQKTPKPEKPKRTASSKDEASNGSTLRRRGSRKSASVLINGISYDISRIPAPVCTCTGNAQQCYRWGIGGWQSACCTTSLSKYPLPLNTKRRGARVAGRKMSQGAFTKVLEKLEGEEGYNLSNPIDLKLFWAKHGTNKFVTIR